MYLHCCEVFQIEVSYQNGFLWRFAHFVLANQIFFFQIGRGGGAWFNLQLLTDPCIVHDVSKGVNWGLSFWQAWTFKNYVTNSPVLLHSVLCKTVRGKPAFNSIAVVYSALLLNFAFFQTVPFTFYFFPFFQFCPCPYCFTNLWFSGGTLSPYDHIKPIIHLFTIIFIWYKFIWKMKCWPLCHWIWAP